MKFHFTKLSIVGLACLSIFISGCSKSNEPASTADTGGINAVLSEANMKKVATAALPQANKETPLEQYIKLDSGNQLMFAYYAFTGLPVDYEAVAERYAQDYRRTSDAFKKKDILAALKPRIDAEIAKIKEQRYFKFDEEVNLSHFDFNKKSFAVQSYLVREGGYLSFNDNNSYGVEITNGVQFAELKVADENTARALEKMVNDRARIVMQIYVFAQDANTSNSRIKVQIVKVKLMDKHGTELLTQ